MRIFAFLLPMVAVAAMGQQPFVYVANGVNYHASITDVIETTQGYSFITALQPPNFDANIEGEYGRLNLIGVFQGSHGLTNANAQVVASALFNGVEESVVALGPYYDYSDTLGGLFQFAFNIDGTVQDSGFFQFDGLRNTTLENALMLPSGELVFAGSGRAQSVALMDRLILLKTNQNCDSITSRVYGNTNMLSISRDIILTPAGIRVSIDGRGPQELPALSGQTRFHTFNEEFDYVSGFGGNCVNQMPCSNLDSVFNSILTMHYIDSNHTFVGSSFGYLSFPLGKRFVVVNLDSTGAATNAFLPRSTYEYDYTGLFNTMATINDAEVYVAMVENAQLGPPNLFSAFQPNRIHVYKLDLDLNVLCEYILDGFEDNAYYYLNRIKTTADGGFMLCGGRKDMSNPNNLFRGWVQRFDATDCTVGLEDLSAQRNVLVYPNPGTTGFQIMIAGQAINDGALDLFSSTGALVRTERVINSQANVDASDLPSGMFHYRIRNKSGASLASGNWMKE